MPREPRREHDDAKKLAQIIYALERAERRLRHEANTLMAAHDYAAELSAEDADRILEAIELLRSLPLIEDNLGKLHEALQHSKPAAVPDRAAPIAPHDTGGTRLAAHLRMVWPGLAGRQ
jgi:hypothetical protein